MYFCTEFILIIRKAMKSYLMNSITCIAICSMTAMVSCTQKQEPVDPILSHIDDSVRPQDDFFEYANGTWFKQHPIPASEQSTGIFTAVDDTVQAQVYQICLEASSTENEKGSNKQKIGDLYASGMDSVALNNNGINELKPEFEKIDAMKSLADLPATLAYLRTVGGGGFFYFGVSQDDKNSSENSVGLSQGGLSLPDRRFYVDEDEKSVDIRSKFVDYMKGMFVTMGYTEADAKASADKVMALEMAMAKSSRKTEDTRDPFKNYNKMSVAQVSKLMPAFNWNNYLNEIGLSKVDSIVVGQPEFFTALNNHLKQSDINTLKDYLKLGLLDGYANYLDDATFMQYFNFYSKTLRGVQEPRPRWKRVVDVTNRVLGDLVGQVYVAEYLPKGTKEKFVEIGNAIKAEFENHIKNLDWMSEPTKEKALKKLAAVNMKLAYPDKWKDMSELEITRDSYVRNMMNYAGWNFKRMISRYGQPVDRTEWHMQPQTYNAYYSPSNNEICIPGCNIIVPGFDGRMPDDAILYAIIGGSTFGHEVTHGFDDTGCNYDAEGNLTNWWTEEDKAKFQAKTKMIVEQFNNYEVVDGLHINGENTQGENIADLGGLIMGFEAFKKTDQYKNNEIIGGFTPAQRYFLGHAQAWMMQFRPEALATRVKSDEHSPAKWRVLGPLSNTVEFYEAFDVKEGDKMWRPENERVKIW